MSDRYSPHQWHPDERPTLPGGLGNALVTVPRARRRQGAGKLR
jgi:hypothetical protein